MFAFRSDNNVLQALVEMQRCGTIVKAVAYLPKANCAVLHIQFSGLSDGPLVGKLRQTKFEYLRGD